MVAEAPVQRRAAHASDPRQLADVGAFAGCHAQREPQRVFGGARLLGGLTLGRAGLRQVAFVCRADRPSRFFVQLGAAVGVPRRGVTDGLVGDEVATGRPDRSAANLSKPTKLLQAQNGKVGHNRRTR